MKETHVVFGSTGALGSAIVRRLREEGKLVRAVARDTELAAQLLPPSAGIVHGDLADPKSIMSACSEAAVVYHCVNIRYSEWVKYMPVLTENILEATRRVGARLVFPGNVYGYGPLQSIPATEGHPQAATSRKGQLRLRLERMLMDAHRAGHVPVVIPRFPDLYGPNVTNPLMAPIFRAALAGKEAGWPGKLDMPHDLVYVDDAARASVLLAETDFAYGETWHVPGPGPMTGRQFVEMVFQASGTAPKVRSLGRLLFRLFGILIPDAGEMVEILHLFEQPLVLDGSKFAEAFPSFQYTRHEDAIRQTVEWFRQQQVPSAARAR